MLGLLFTHVLKVSGYEDNIALEVPYQVEEERSDSIYTSAPDPCNMI